MSEADTFIDRFLQDQDDIKDTWKLYAINPYSGAYETALESFKATLKAQEDADKAAAKLKFDLLMLGLSLCGGGILTAAFGTTVMKTIASDAAIHVICRYNMERAFRAANILATNKTAGFIAGKVWDEAEKRATDFVSGEVQKGMEQNAGNFPSTQKIGAVKMSTSLEDFVLEAKVKAAAVAKGIRDNPKIKNDDKIAQVSKLKQSKFWNPPQKSVDNGSLADEIELAFYMNMVMNTDYLVSYETYYVSVSDGLGHGREGRIRNYQKKEITESARDKKYPMDYRSERGTIDYERIGDEIRKRMNELYKAKFKEKFIDGKIGPLILIRAEQTLEILAANNIKRQIESV